MRYTRYGVWVLLSLVLFAPLIAMSEFDICTDLVKTALDATNDLCVDTGRNSACYGHVNLQAEAQPGFGDFKFDEVGDTVNVAHLNSLRLSPMDLDNGTWGVALLRLQADIPDDKPENVNLLLFGDVEVENLAPEPVLMNVTMRSSGNVNVRRDPESTAFVMGTLSSQDEVVASGRSEDGEWIYVAFPDDEEKKGWVRRSFVESDNSLNGLNVVQPNMTEYGPMQAFYLKTGNKQSSCEEAPNDGLLVQTPEGVAEVRLWINEVKIRLGSTAFIQSSPGNRMMIKTLEGKASVEALGVEQVAVAGTGVTIQLNSNSGAAAPPSAPKAYQVGDVQNLPVDNLDRPITVVVQDEVTGELTPVAEVTTQVDNTTVDTPTSGGNAEVTDAPDATEPPPVVTSTEEPTATDAPVVPTDVPPRPTDTDVPPPPPTLEPPPPTVEPPPADPGTGNTGTEGSGGQSGSPSSPPEGGTEEAPQ